MNTSVFEKKVSRQKELMKRYSGLNSVIRTRFDEAKKESASHAGLLSDFTILVKDNISIQGTPLTCASKVLEGNKALYHATVIEKMISAGGAITGQTNQDEFAMGSSTEYSCYGPSKNPFDPSRVTGGSSGGSAAAVAVGLADMALGSDTGGSVRLPAAFCGVYGLKPTYGRVSRYGLVAYASSFDQIGPIALTVDDITRLFVAISGHDPRDSTSSQEPVPGLDRCRTAPLPAVVGIPRKLIEKGVHAHILSQLEQLESFCLDQGIKVKDVDFPHNRYAIAAYYILTTAEASSNLARFDGIRYGYRFPAADLREVYEQSRSKGFGSEVKRRIMLGTYVLSSGYYDAYYSQAQRVRRLIKNDFNTVFKDVDLIIMPTAPSPAFLLGEKINDPLAMYLMDSFTVPMNLAGIPALNIPSGKTSSGLPLGLQLVGNTFQEETIFSLARRVEKENLFS